MSFTSSNFVGPITPQIIDQIETYGAVQDASMMALVLLPHALPRQAVPPLFLLRLLGRCTRVPKGKKKTIVFPFVFAPRPSLLRTFQSELISFLDERVHMMEGEAMGTVPAAVFAGTDNALANCMAEVGLRVYT